MGQNAECLNLPDALFESSIPTPIRFVGRWWLPPIIHGQLLQQLNYGGPYGELTGHSGGLLATGGRSLGQSRRCECCCSLCSPLVLAKSERLAPRNDSREPNGIDGEIQECSLTERFNDCKDISVCCSACQIVRFPMALRQIQTIYLIASGRQEALRIARVQKWRDSCAAAMLPSLKIPLSDKRLI